MSGPEEFAFRPETFSGVARLFPLPNLVLFPHVVQPLRIFEPRYCDLLEDALTDDGLIAMALLKPGWEGDYEGQPPIEPVVCLGRVVTHRREPQGHYNILLLGLRRAAVQYELPRLRSFRQAQLQLLEDCTPQTGQAHRERLRNQLLEHFQRLAPRHAEWEEEVEALLHKGLPLGVLTDIVAFIMGLKIAVKQQLLSVCDVDQRARQLLRHLRALETGGAAASDRVSRFPREFSRN